MRLPSAGLLALTACYQPSFEPCAVSCAAGDVCPGETTCAADGFCHRDGEAPCGAPPDAPPLDAGPDGAPPTPPTIRHVRDAYFTSWTGTTFTSGLGMSVNGFEIAADGVADGELVILIGSIDNGSATIWPDPLAPGFTQLTEEFYGPDGQAFVVAYKIGDDEPATYSGSYGSGIGSGSATLTLLAATGFDPVDPIRESLVTTARTATDPVLATSTGLSIEAPGAAVVFASGVDWVNHTASSTAEPPAGYTQLTAFGDHGDASWDWTAQAVAIGVRPPDGLTGALTTTFDSPWEGAAWSVVFAIAPE